MSCPPGTILNPRTLRCVKVTGRRAQQLVRAGNIGEANVAFAPQPQRQPYYRPYFQPPAAAPAATLWWPAVAPPPARRRTQRRDRGAFVPSPTRDFVFPDARARAPAPPRIPAAALPCPPEQERNPATGRCIKLAGRTFKRIHAPAAPPPLAPRLVAPARDRDRAAQEGPLGRAAVAPLADRTAVLSWAAENCRNAVDPLTGAAFVTADTTALQELIRLHDRTCTLAAPLDRTVAAAHAAGALATVPGDPSTPLTLADFKALRAARRRRDPGYRIPARKHAPPPATWQLYIASDARSGPEFATVAYVEPAKARRTPFGIEYPPEAYRVDLGFIPTAGTAATATCSPQQLVDLLERLARANRLLVPVAGGWRPLPGMGFPLSKRHWETDRPARIGALCEALAAALESPV